MVARTEEEYAQLIRDFVKKYAGKLSAILMIAAASGGGWWLWQEFRSNKLDAAANLYYSVFKQQEETQSYMNDQREDLPEANVEDAWAVKNTYPDSIYAVFSSLYLARLHVIDEAFDEAVTELEWALEKASDVAIRDAIRGRIARIMNEQGRTRSAIEVLDGMETEAAQIMAAELRGDALFLEGQTAQAREAYAEAATATPGSGQSVAIEWKLRAWPSAKTQTIKEAKDRRNRRRYSIVSTEPVPTPEPDIEAQDDAEMQDAEAQDADGAKSDVQ